jgi:hypothetical protein
MKAAPVTLALVTALAASPAFAQPEKESIGDAVVQPLRDLSVIRQKTPQILQKAAEAPYAAAGDCALMRQEIADLDEILGDDIGAVNDDGSTIVTSAVKSVVKLPFAGIIRRITGAQKRDQAYEDALVAGVARRAYLKGAMTACTQAPPLVPEVAVTVPLVPELAPTGEAKVVVATAP